MIAQWHIRNRIRFRANRSDIQIRESFREQTRQDQDQIQSWAASLSSCQVGEVYRSLQDNSRKNIACDSVFLMIFAPVFGEAELPFHRTKAADCHLFSINGAMLHLLVP